MKLKSMMMPLIKICLFSVILFGVSKGTESIALANVQKERNEMLRTLLPGSTSFTEEVYNGDDASIKAVYKAENGSVIMTSVYGYAGDIILLVGVDTAGIVTGLVVREMSETYGLGANALTDEEFLTQFLGTSGEAQIGSTVDAMSGATVTSKAVAKGVNAAVGYMTGVDTTSGATTWGD